MHDSQSILRPLNIPRTSTAASSRRLRSQHVIRICVLRRTKPQQGTSSSPSKSRLFPMRIPLHAAGSAVHVSTTTVACLQRNYTRERLSHTWVRARKSCLRGWAFCPCREQQQHLRSFTETAVDACAKQSGCAASIFLGAGAQPVKPRPARKLHTLFPRQISTT
jgi:hypothetical protein